MCDNILSRDFSFHENCGEGSVVKISQNLLNWRLVSYLRKRFGGLDNVFGKRFHCFCPETPAENQN